MFPPYSETLVLKFGGAAVATAAQFASIADLIISRKKECPRLVVVVSAMGKTTDELIELAKQVHPNPPQREYDMLISVGERISMSLLAMALCCKGEEAVSFTGSQSGIMTCSHHSNARIIDMRPDRLKANLDRGKIVIVAGFQGVSENKEITTLGRGGSDTSAVALALALKASRVEFFKDVPGIFYDDPKMHQGLTPYSCLDYQEMLKILQRGAKVLHPRAVQLAAKNGLPLHVRSFISSYKDHTGTWIFDKDKERESVPIYEA